ncbi:MAG: CYTH domain-containing protein [Rudaea sp.]
MGIEIERKFLVGNDAWRMQQSHARRMLQGYLIDAALVATREGVRCSMRVRVAGDEAWLNIKSADLGVARIEYEYPIPVDDANRMLRDFCHGVVDKTRHYVPVDGMLFEVDEFHGDNAGLIVAELELDAVDRAFPRPEWLGKEVSSALRYYNLNLLAHPYSRWTASERNGD